MSQIDTLYGDIVAVESSFQQVLSDPGIKFQAEAGFAIQLLQSNEYLAKIAFANRQTLVDAITNVAAIGVSLNPAAKHAYLVPRKGKIVLDISYIGLLHLAMASGAIVWGQAHLVRAADRFVLTGIDTPPTHERNPFATDQDRGEIVGAYVVVKTAGGDYLTHTMNIEAINAIRDTSEAWKSYKTNGKSCPWSTHYGEMCRKTVVKQASKYWPHNPRLEAAIYHVDTEGGEGFPVAGERDVTPSTEQEQQRLQQLLASINRDWPKLAEHALQGRYAGRPITEVTADDMANLIGFVESIARRKK